MSTPLAPSAGNIQRWAFIKLVQYPNTDRTGAARDTSTNKNLLWHILFDWKDAIQADGGFFAWGEMYKGWTLCLAEASAATLTAISNDPRTSIRVLPQKQLTATLTAGQVNTITNYLTDIGMDAQEIADIDLANVTVRQFLTRMQKGMWRPNWDENTGLYTTLSASHVGVVKTVDDVINEYNYQKLGLIPPDPSPDYGVVDNFNRANENPLAGNGRWVTGTGDNGAFKIVSSGITTTAGDGFTGTSMFLGAFFGGDVQIAATIPSFGTGGTGSRDIVNMCTNLQNAITHPTEDWFWYSAQEGYRARITYAFTGPVWTTLIEKKTAYGDSWTTLATTTGTTWTANDQIYYNVAASGTHTIYRNGVSVITATDSAWAGKVGAVCLRNTGFLTTQTILDDFIVGGTITEIRRWQTAASDATVGTLSWSSANNAKTSNDSRTTAALATDQQSNYLKLTSHNSTNYPTNTTFQGFIVYGEVNATVASRANWTDVRLVVGDAITGDLHSDSTTFPTTEADVPTAGMGTSTDMWGLSPSVSGVNGTGMGVAGSVLASNSVTAGIDVMRLRIYSTLSSSSHTTKTLTGKADIRKTTTQTITGKADIKKTGVQQTLTGKGDIRKSTSRTLTGVARIKQTVTKTLTGVARIKKTVTKTLTGVAKIGTSGSSSQSITGKGDIRKSASQTITGLARIRVTVARTLTGKGDIRKSASQTITGKGDIRKSASQTLTGRSRILKTVSKTLTGIARVKVSVTKSITGKADIRKTGVQRTLTGKAFIVYRTTKQISGVASIIGAGPSMTINAIGVKASRVFGVLVERTFGVSSERDFGNG